MNTTAIWKDFNDELLGFIKARVNNPDTAQDMLQEVFIKIHQGFSQLSSKDKLASWVYQITRNTIIDYYRKKKLPVSDDSIFQGVAEEESDSSLNPQFINCLMPFVNQLPEKYKEALNKTVYGDLSQKEYAQELDISYTAVKSRVQRARQKLKELFTQCCNIQTDSYGNIISSNIDDCSC